MLGAEWKPGVGIRSVDSRQGLKSHGGGERNPPQRAVKLRRRTIFFEPARNDEVLEESRLGAVWFPPLPGGVLAVCLMEAETGKFPHQRSTRRIRERKIHNKPRNPKSHDGQESFKFVLCVKRRHCHTEEVATGSILSSRWQ